MYSMKWNLVLFCFFPTVKYVEWLNRLTWNAKSYAITAFSLCYFDIVAEGVCSRHAVRRWCDSGVVQLGTIFFTTWNFDSFPNFLKLAKSSPVTEKERPTSQTAIGPMCWRRASEHKATHCLVPPPNPSPTLFPGMAQRLFFIEQSHLLPSLPSRYIYCTLKCLKKNISDCLLTST